MDNTQTVPVKMTQSYRLANKITLAFGAIITLLVVIGVGLGLLAIINGDGIMSGFSHLFFIPVVTSIYGLIGIQITLRSPMHIIGWLLLIITISSAITLLSGSYREYHQVILSDDVTPLSDFFIWLNTWVWWIPSISPLTLLLLYFPNGQLPSRRWRPIALLTLILLVLAMVASGFHPGTLERYGLNNTNPYGILALADVFEDLLDVVSVGLFISLVASFASVTIRYRHASGIERIQLKWLVFAAGLAVSVLLSWALVWLLLPDTPFMLEMGMTLTTVGVTLVIVAIGIAILKHQLWDIDTLINRSLVYGLLWIMIASAYIVAVTFLSRLFDENTLFFSLMSTALVAVSFHPLKDWIQKRINRLMFGDRDDPYVVLERLSKQLEPIVIVDEVLPTIVKSIGEALQLPYVAIALAQGDGYKVTATYPEDLVDSHYHVTRKVSLDYHKDHIGQLWLAVRSGHESFSREEINLLETIARQTSAAAHNVRLTTELRRSREQIITTREEERRRLRRDLHDGLGPALAAMSFQLDAIRNIVSHDPVQAQTIATDLKAQVQSSLSEIRRIAYNLRPPALDELGLLDALRQHVESAQSAGNIYYNLDFPESLPLLPAAVEVAAYRIILEAVTNVQRHAQATSCAIRINLDDDHLDLDILDDGCGIADGVMTGVGLNAMRERATELSGSFFVEQPNIGGTNIRAVLPCDLESKANSWTKYAS